MYYTCANTPHQLQMRKYYNTRIQTITNYHFPDSSVLAMVPKTCTSKSLKITGIVLFTVNIVTALNAQTYYMWHIFHTITSNNCITLQACM